MWAQLIIMRLKPGKEDDLPRLYEQLRAAEQPGSGLLRTTAARDQKDPSRVYNFVIFESEERARATSRTRRAKRPSRVSGRPWPRSSRGRPSSSTSRCWRTRSTEQPGQRPHALVNR